MCAVTVRGCEAESGMGQRWVGGQLFCESCV